MIKTIVWLTIGCSFLYGGGDCLKCYSCSDNTERGNCEEQCLEVLENCPYSCVTYQGRAQQNWNAKYAQYNVTNYRRGCGEQKKGCAEIKKDFHKAYSKVYEFDCQECKSDLCNSRDNHPGYKFRGTKKYRANSNVCNHECQ